MNNRKTLLITTLPALTACERDSNEPAAAQHETDGSPIATDSVAEAAIMQRTASPEGATVAFVTPRDGALVSSPFRVELRVQGMQVVPAGTEAPGSHEQPVHSEPITIIVE